MSSQPFERAVAEISTRFARDLVAILRKASLEELATLKTNTSLPKLGVTPETMPTIDELERRYVIEVLRTTNGNFTEACKILGINRRTLYRKHAAWGLSR